MKYYLFKNFILYILIVICISCQRDNLNNPIKIVGDKTNVSIYKNFNDSLFVETFRNGINYINLNNDTLEDLKFESYCHYYFGGSCYSYGMEVHAINNTEILTDTTLKEVSKDVYGSETEFVMSKINTPMKFNFGDTIKIDKYWAKNEKLVFNYKLDECGENYYALVKYNGWISKNPSYMVFRIVGQDTLYGWIKLKTSNTELIIYEYAIY